MANLHNADIRLKANGRQEEELPGPSRQLAFQERMKIAWRSPVV